MVRAASDQQQTRGARISLLSALFAGVVIVVAWMSLRQSPPPKPTQRSLVNCRVPWVCERDPAHQFVDYGRFEPMPCRICGGRCYIQLRYVCPVHEREFDAFVQFERIEDDESASAARERVCLYRYDSASQWQQTSGNVPCPVSGCTAETRRPNTSWSEQSHRTSTSGGGDGHAGS